MAMRVHELHAAAVHGPLVLLPAAAAVDLGAAISGNRRTAELGRRLWWFTVGAAGVAGIAGLAASQEVRTDEPETSDMLWLHGVGNFAILLGGLALALWRTYRRPSVAAASLGLGAAALAGYTAYLGGELVYTHGVGVRPNGVRESPCLLSRAAPGTFARDAVGGLRWLIARTARAIFRRELPDRRAFGAGGERPSDLPEIAREL
jgi:uncharacterized membrane protein